MYTEEQIAQWRLKAAYWECFSEKAHNLFSQENEDGSYIRLDQDEIDKDAVLLLVADTFGFKL